MRAIVCDGFGEPSVMRLRDCVQPELAQGQVLIRVCAAGVNRPDILQRMGLYAPPESASPILGLEVAGEIVAGDVRNSRFKIGDAVCALTNGGGYAEYVAVDIRHCLPIPQGWSMLEAASLPEAFFTVWFNVFALGHLNASLKESLLVHSGASGVGTAAIQMARALGHCVYATTRSVDKIQACLDLGATQVFDLQSDWVASIVAVGGVDVVLDVLAGEFAHGNIKVLNAKGRLVWIAFLAGQKIELSVAQIMRKEIRLTGSFLRSQSNETKAKIAQDLHEKIWPHIQSGAIKSVVHRAFDWHDVAAAHECMARNRHVGKIVLQIAPF